MYSHVACDVMKERTLYLLKPSSLIWHLMPYLFLLDLMMSFGRMYAIMRGPRGRKGSPDPLEKSQKYRVS